MNPRWLDASTATGSNIIDIAITSEYGLMSPRACFAFICAVAQLHSPARDQFLLAASNRYKHTGVLARCDGAQLAHVRMPTPPPPSPSQAIIVCMVSWCDGYVQNLSISKSSRIMFVDAIAFNRAAAGGFRGKLWR